MNNGTIDTEYLILENIYDSGEKKTSLRQRDIALKTGASLGLTNTILRRLAQKGWITIKKLNRRNIQYAVTLEGINEIIRRSYNYFKRTIKNAVYYKETIDNIIRSAKQAAVNAVILVGISDLDFIVEHACHTYGISFLKSVDAEKLKTENANIMKIYAETISDFPAAGEAADSGNFIEHKNILYLSKLVMKQEIELQSTTSPRAGYVGSERVLEY